ncbi:MAG: hypothetical protein IPL46_01335 [Saprospiraceae bacterium]|nr:hypothetical protein [Saprospiraceae bacterium]
MIPKFLAGYNAYFNGWDVQNVAATGGVGIHHPNGDIKKISTFTGAAVSTTWGSVPNTHWEVSWVATANGHGITEQGSSGSPLFNSAGLMIGTLTGGNSFCNTPTFPDQFGKMSYHWISNGATANTRLKNWLDPDATGVTSLTGTNNGCMDLPPCDGTDINLPGTIATGIYIYSNSIQSDGMVQIANNVTLHAGNFVQLNPNFAVNGQIEIVMAGCQN